LKYVKRSLRMLKAALPESSLEWDPAFADEEVRLREQSVGVALTIGHIFSICSKLLSIEVTPDGDRRDGELVGDVELVAKFTLAPDRTGDVAATFTLSSEARSFKRKEAVRQLEAAVGRPIDWPGLSSALAGKINVWQLGSLTLTRESFLASIVGKHLDADVFFSRRNSRVSVLALEQQDMLVRPPAYWNRATVGNIPGRLAAGMDPHAYDRNGVSALVAATIFGSVDTVTALCAAGADPNAVDGSGHSAMSAAIAAKNWPGFRHLLREGGDPNGPRSMPTLLVALRNSAADVAVEQIIAAGGDVGRWMPDGRPFNDPLDRFKPGASSDGAWAWGKVEEMVRSKMTEEAIVGSVEYDGVPSENRLSKSGPAL
jgi:hypothetical protein